MLTNASFDLKLISVAVRTDYEDVMYRKMLTLKVATNEDHRS